MYIGVHVVTSLMPRNISGTPSEIVFQKQSYSSLHSEFQD